MTISNLGRFVLHKFRTQKEKDLTGVYNTEYLGIILDKSRHVTKVTQMQYNITAQPICEQ
jgi:hypothetical protein